VVVQLRVESDGRVSQSKVKSSTLKDATTEECVTHVISRRQFASGKKADTFDLSFPFARR